MSLSHRLRTSALPSVPRLRQIKEKGPENHIGDRLLFYGIAVLGTAALVLQVINVTVWNRFWPFFALIFMHLIAALIQFVRMVLLPPHGSE